MRENTHFYHFELVFHTVLDIYSSEIVLTYTEMVLRIGFFKKYKMSLVGHFSLRTALILFDFVECRGHVAAMSPVNMSPGIAYGPLKAANGPRTD